MLEDRTFELDEKEDIEKLAVISIAISLKRIADALEEEFCWHLKLKDDGK